jgi:hypothetical protein
MTGVLKSSIRSKVQAKSSILIKSDLNFLIKDSVKEAKEVLSRYEKL